jgi:mRNA-degrading endonuclease toxin of MazEF toxin-antitoxin module
MRWRCRRCAFLREPSVANVQGIASLPLPRLERKLGDLSPDVLASIRKAVVSALDLA